MNIELDIEHTHPKMLACIITPCGNILAIGDSVGACTRTLQRIGFDCVVHEDLRVTVTYADKKDITKQAVISAACAFFNKNLLGE